MQTRLCRIHAPHDLRIETGEVGAPGPGEVLVRIGAGGICGSDLHYYHHGGFGTVRLKQPMILGHEVAGTVEVPGAGVTGLAPGDRVALNPSKPCGGCTACLADPPQPCGNVDFYGSAMKMPHVDGGFRELLIADARQCVPVPDATLAEAACAEPLAVCLHAAAQAGPLAGASVLVTGAGPIGVLCAAVAAQQGAAEIVVTDLEEAALAMARRMGATATVNAASDPEGIAALAGGKGRFDVSFECSGAAPAVRSALAATRPRGTLVQVGLADGDVPVPLGSIAVKELTLRGTFRFGAEFAEAAALINTRAIDLRPIITGSYPLAEAQAAFHEAGDRSRATKVQLVFG